MAPWRLSAVSWSFFTSAAAFAVANGAGANRKRQIVVSKDRRQRGGEARFTLDLQTRIRD